MQKSLFILVAALCIASLAGLGITSTPQEKTEADVTEKTIPVLEGVRQFSTDSTQSVIETGINYNGQKIDFFGSMEGVGADSVVVKLTSPAETVKINVKGRFGPFWMNTRQYEVDNVPAIYKLFATGKLSEILTPELANELGIGFSFLKARLRLRLLKGKAEENDPDTVFKGLVQLKEEEELYSITEGERLVVKEDNLFRHSIRFPAAAKPGTYHVETYAFSDNRLAGYSKDTILIKKVGLVAFIFNASKKNPVIYGIAAVVIALGAGLLVGFIFKGGGHH